jgi:hypothetical protein
LPAPIATRGSGNSPIISDTFWPLPMLHFQEVDAVRLSQTGQNLGNSYLVKRGVRDREVDGTVPSLDIFRMESGDLRWCEAVTNMETAKARIEKLAVSSRGNCFVFDQKSDQRIHVSVEPGRHGPRVDMG